MNVKQILYTLALLAISAAASANLVTNGDFEAGPAPTIANPYPTPDGWTLTGTDTSLSGIAPGGPGASVYEYLSATFVSTADLSQTLSTVAGGHYNLGIDLQLDGNGFINIVFDGNVVLTETNTGGLWQTFNLSNLIATGANTTLEIVSENDTSFNAVDNVMVNTPEPGALALIALGLGALRLVRRRHT